VLGLLCGSYQFTTLKRYLRKIYDSVSLGKFVVKVGGDDDEEEGDDDDDGGGGGGDYDGGRGCGGGGDDGAAAGEYDDDDDDDDDHDAPAADDDEGDDDDDNDDDAQTFLNAIEPQDKQQNIASITSWEDLGKVRCKGTDRDCHYSIGCAYSFVCGSPASRGASLRAVFIPLLCFHAV
jgi:hypothetical protein